MRAIAAVSIESGSGASRSEATARRRSRRNCGFPPERSAASRRTCGGSGSSSVTASARASASSSAQRAAARRATTAGPGQRPEPRARVAARDDDEPRLAADVLGDPPEQVGRGGVHEVRVLDLDERGLAQPVAQEAQDDVVQPRAPEGGRELARPGAWPACRPRRASASSGTQGSSVGVPRADGGPQALEDDVVGVLPDGPDERPQELAPGGVRPSRSCRPRTSRAGASGPGARSRSSSISRVLPMPGSPVICTSRPVPRPTEATASSSRASSRARPTSGKRSATPSPRRGCRSRARPTTPGRAASCP